ncbi:hypothetical protein WAI453_000348 [Rhynchosporium graminicola]
MGCYSCVQKRFRHLRWMRGSDLVDSSPVRYLDLDGWRGYGKEEKTDSTRTIGRKGLPGLESENVITDRRR